MFNLNLVNHPKLAKVNPNFAQYRGSYRSGGMGSRLKNMDWILLIVGIVCFTMATALSGLVTPYLTQYGGATLAPFLQYVPTCFQLGGAVAAIAALAGKRVFS